MKLGRGALRGEKERLYWIGESLSGEEAEA